MIAELAAILAPTFICPAIGYFWAKQGHDYDVMFVNRVSVNLAAPCLVFATFSTANIDGTLLRSFGLASLTVLALTGILAFVTLRLSRRSVRSYLGAITFNNCGNVGLPLAMFAFGDPGLAFAIIFFALSSLLNLVFSPWVASGNSSPLVLLRSPIIYAVAAAMLFLGLDVAPPRWLANTTGIIGGLLIPLMLITLGVSLARIRLSSFWTSLWFAVWRLVIGFAAGWVVAELFGLEGVAKAVLILQSAMPVAVFNYLFAVRYNRNADEVAGMVLLSTLIGFALLPALLWWLLSFTG